MNRALFPEGVDIFNEDYTAIPDMVSTEIKRRWVNTIETAGIVAKRPTDNVLYPTTGSSAGTIQVSVGGAYVPSGEYVSISGTSSLTGLTNANMSAATIYVAIQALEVSSSTRRHSLLGTMLPTRASNDQSKAAIILVSGVTGSSYITIGKVTNITAGGAVTLDVSDQYRPVLKIASTVAPAAPASVTVVTGLIDRDLVYSSTGTPAKAQGFQSEAYAKVSFPTTTHNDGIYGYIVQLRFFNGAATPAELTGSSLSQMLYVCGDLTGTTTAVTFYGLTAGLRAQAYVYALSNGAIPVISVPTTSSTFFVGNLTQSITPAVTVTQKVYGLELSWDALDSGASGITQFEVFAATDASATASTVDYATLVWRGYGSRAPIMADLGDTIYYQVRGVDARGQIATSARTGSEIVVGGVLPAAPCNVLVYTGVEVNSNRAGSKNLANPAYRNRISVKASQSVNKPYIEASWGWEGSSGAWTDKTGTTRQFDMPTQVRLVDSNGTAYDLTGWYLVFQSSSEKRNWHKITSNTSSTVRTSPVAGWDYNATASGIFWITPGADEYEVSVQMVDLSVMLSPDQTTGGGYAGGGTTPKTDPITQTAIQHIGWSSVGSSPTTMRYRYENPIIGACYDVKVRGSNRGGYPGSWSEIKTIIAGIGAQLTMPEVSYKVYGTRVTCNWRSVSDALGYEVSYTVDGTQPTFDGDNSNVSFAYCNNIDIMVQAGDTLTATFRVVDTNGQVSSNSVTIVVPIGVPQGYYGLSPYNLTLSHTTGPSPSYQTIDFPFPFTVRYLTVYVSSGNVVTGDTIEFRVYPVNEPDSERNIAITWQEDQTGVLVRQEGQITVRGDGSVTLRIDSSSATSGRTIIASVVVWYEQSDITPPGGNGNVSPIDTARVRTSQSFNSGGNL